MSEFSYLVDAPVYVFRAFFSLPDSIRDANDQPGNALYGFAGFLAEFFTRARPQRLAIAFDESLSSSFRNDIYPAYKANRPPAPEELKAQFGRCRALCEALGITTLADCRFEADDYIGSLAAEHARANRPVCILSRDKDLLQLLGPHDIYWDFASDKRLGPDQVMEVWGVRPDQIADYLALAGDTVDNIPGIAGVGPKAAQALLGAFDTLDGIYQRLDEVPTLSVRGAKSLHRKLLESEASARLSRQLTQIKCDVPLPQDACAWHAPGADQTLADELELIGLGGNIRERLMAALHGLRTV